MGKKTCENCEQAIGNLEESFLYKNHVVCKKCKILLEEESQAIEAIHNNAETEIPIADTPSQDTADTEHESTADLVQQDEQEKGYGGIRRTGYSSVKGLKMKKGMSIILALTIFLIFIICQQCYENSRWPSSPPKYKPPKTSSISKKWGYDMYYAAQKELYEHPERGTCFHPRYGIIGNGILAFRYPGHLIQATVEGILFLLPGILGYILGRWLSKFLKKGNFLFPWLGFYIFLLDGIFINIHFEYKNWGISPKVGFYFPAAILLIGPACSLIGDLWVNKKPVEET